MKILAIESATMVASVALISDETLLAEYTVNHKKNTLSDSFIYD